MSSSWPVLSDLQITAEQPAGNWIVRRLRERDRRGFLLVRGDDVLYAQGTDASESWPWTTYKTLRMVAPPSYFGDGGIQFAATVTVHVLGDASGIPTPGGIISASFRLKLGSVYSSVIRASITRTGTGPLHVPTVTGLAVLTSGFTSGQTDPIEFQMSINNPSPETAQGEFRWLAGYRHYFCAMPR